eukprot:COSAG01_NODE_2907_length_6880_cov_10.488204_5_plen_291_part_00
MAASSSRSHSRKGWTPITGERSTGRPTMASTGRGERACATWIGPIDAGQSATERAAAAVDDGKIATAAPAADAIGAATAAATAAAKGVAATGTGAGTGAGTAIAIDNVIAATEATAMATAAAGAGAEAGAGAARLLLGADVATAPAVAVQMSRVGGPWAAACPHHRAAVVMRGGADHRARSRCPSASSPRMSALKDETVLRDSTRSVAASSWSNGRRRHPPRHSPGCVAHTALSLHGWLSSCDEARGSLCPCLLGTSLPYAESPLRWHLTRRWPGRLATRTRSLRLGNRN